MKMYEKSGLSLIDGVLVAADGTIVVPDPKVVNQANELETQVQEAAYLMKQHNAAPVPSLSGFERKSVFEVKERFTAKTPTLDKKAYEAMALMDELDDVNRTTDINNHIQHFADLVRFADADRIMCFEDSACFNRFDTPVLGDPLKLSVEDVIDHIAFIHGLIAAEENGKAEADEQE